MKFSTYALAAALVASVANGFAGPQVTPRFARQVRSSLRLPMVLLLLAGAGRAVFRMLAF